ncbi:MAG: hypothetical protein AAF437_04655 [Pseudomonadota bacterium]
MSQVVNSNAPSEQSDAWLKGLPSKIAKGLCGIIAVLVALKAAAYTPSETELFAHQEHFVRILAFAALTVWTALTIGLQRRGAAAMITLAFAIFVEMLLVPARDAGMPSIVSANLGIVFAYCGLQLYCLSKERSARS